MFSQSNQLFRIVFGCADTRTILAGVALISWLNGCAITNARPVSATRARAFIEYWPPQPGNNKLRLAVKDLIDMKGVVTTAGSEFLAKQTPPAKRTGKFLAS